MYSTLALVLAFLALDAAIYVNAGLYVIQPSRGFTCHGGEECTIEWLDDGSHPLLTTIGVCDVGLFTGNQQLAQTIQPVDVSRSHSITFKPNPKAGPNSNTYYISISSTTLKNGTEPYTNYSPFFQLDQMSGSFSSPLPSATSAIPIPSSLTQSSAPGGSTSTSTSTIGTLSTLVPSVSPSPSSSSVALSSSLTASSSALLASPTVATPSSVSPTSSPPISPSLLPTTSSLSVSASTKTSTSAASTQSRLTTLVLPPSFASTSSPSTTADPGKVSDARNSAPTPTPSANGTDRRLNLPVSLLLLLPVILCSAFL